MEDNNYTIIKPVESMHNIGNIKHVDREQERKKKQNLNQKKENENEPLEDEINEQDIDKVPNGNIDDKNGEHSIDFCA